MLLKEMVHDLESHGCVQNKTFIIEVPDIDANLMHHFIRAFLMEMVVFVRIVLFGKLSQSIFVRQA